MGMHIIMGMPLQVIIMGIPMPIMVIMRVQQSFIMSMVMPAMGFMVQTMPSAVISQVMVLVITGIIMGMPPMVPPIMGICIIGIMGICIMGMVGIWVVGICMAVIMVLTPRRSEGRCPHWLTDVTLHSQTLPYNRAKCRLVAFLQ